MVAPDIDDEESFERLPTTDDYINLIEDPHKQTWMRGMNSRLMEDAWPLTCLLLEMLWDLDRTKISIESLKQDIVRLVP